MSKTYLITGATSPLGQLFFQLCNNNFRLYTQHRVHSAGHPHIRNITCSVWQHGFVCGRHMRVCSKQCRHTTVQIIAHCALFSGSLCVQIHYNNLCSLLRSFVNQTVNGMKWTIQRF